eukprot:TRINITY_DN23302_c0_g1_i1.p1 TRINITY_DN23302_c0_g1~~TRINITY_DN23302_c0_g1_i1.p1  ORF type:complete len:166 (+),score=34.14 TRINITY_DN23302_c0_g1_i1:68-499(+)
MKISNAASDEDDIFNDSDDDLLLTAVEEVEKSMNASSVISIDDDSDTDDQPLVRSIEEVRPGTSDGSKADEVDELESDDDEPLLRRIDASLEQDEMDLLVSFENKDGNREKDGEDEGEFACPVCQMLIPNSKMNRHLSECLDS